MGMIQKWPTNMELWEDYIAIRGKCQQEFAELKQAGKAGRR